MSNPKIKRPRDQGPRSVTGMYVPWRLTAAEPGESVRWQCVDGRWVAISLGQGPELGKTVVSNSDGQRQLVDDYQSALELAKRWRV